MVWLDVRHILSVGFSPDKRVYVGGTFVVCSWGNWLTVHKECLTAVSRRIHSELVLGQAL